MKDSVYSASHCVTFLVAIHHFIQLSLTFSKFFQQVLCFASMQVGLTKALHVKHQFLMRINRQNVGFLCSLVIVKFLNLLPSLLLILHFD